MYSLCESVIRRSPKISSLYLTVELNSDHMLYTIFENRTNKIRKCVPILLVEVKK